MTLQRIPRAKRNQGLSLIELLVSLAIGLMLTLACIAAYLGASHAARISEAQVRMNEDGQAALAILTQQLRMAGDNPGRASSTAEARRNPVYAPATPATTLSTTFTPTAFAIRGCDTTFRNIKTATNLDGLVCTAQTGGAGNTAPSPHSIAITYEADAFNTVPTAKGVPIDCLGNALATHTATLTTPLESGSTTSSVDYHVADNRFYVGTTTTVVSPSLYCKGSAGAPQPLVENVEDMQFSYGVMAAGTAGAASVAGYLSAGAIGTAAQLAHMNGDAARWAQVAVVHICILVRSESPVVDDAASARYRKCDGVLESRPPDLRLRRTYSTTVALRNRLGAPSLPLPP